MSNSSDIAFQVYELLCKEVAEQGGNEEDVKRLLTVSGSRGRAVLVRYLVKVGNVHRNCYHVSIRHTSFEEAVAATGCVTEPLITAEAFKIEAGEIVVDTDIILFHIGEWYVGEGGRLELGVRLTDAYVEYVHNLLGVRPATILELLALAECCSELGRATWIYARGSHCFTSQGVAAPYLMANKRCFKESGGRWSIGAGEYSNPYDGSDWDPDIWFAGVPV